MRILLTLMTLLTGFAVSATDAQPASPPEYDEALATELGADDYGMKMYVMALLKAGPHDQLLHRQRRLGF